MNDAFAVRRADTGPGPVRTTCPYCGVGCGLIVETAADGQAQVKGDPDHPANYGRLCSKGAALAETLDLEGRLLQPEIDGRPSDWSEALLITAMRLSAIIARHGPDAVAFYASGQLLTEDYYVANKLMKGFIGSANIDTNSRLCMSSAVAGHKRAFGADSVPVCYEDLEQADLILLIGSNAAWTHPVLYQRMQRARQDKPGQRIVVIDPRRTASCEHADLHLALRPGTDQDLFNGLLVYLDQQQAADQDFIEQHTEGLDAALRMAQALCPTVQQTARRCGLPVAQVERFFALFRNTPRVVSLFSQGINQWSYGTDRVNAIINCHLFTGRIGRPGMGPFSITGQPNAMGGREVGGLANQLAAHLELQDPAQRALLQAFWQAPRMADKEGLKAVQLFQAIEAGQIKAVWIMATNPAVSLPDAEQVRRALSRCELVIVSDCMRHTDTTAYAHILLPAATWGEREGTVTNSERRISRQRAFLPLPGEARPDWWILSRVAQQMGFDQAFDYAAAWEIFREHAALSGHANAAPIPTVNNAECFPRDFDISAFASITAQQYAQLQPVQWPVTVARPQGTPRLFADGRFYTQSQRARFIAVEAHQPAQALDADYPLILNSGRLRDQWHTMTRTGKAARLSGHSPEPAVEVHPQDAAAAGVQDGELVRIRSRRGEIIMRVRHSTAQQPGSVFVPMHWNDQYASRACVDTLVNPALDPWSGQPEFKHTPVRLDPWQPRWHGFILSRRRLDLSKAEYWACTRGESAWRYEIAGDDLPQDWAATARQLLCRQAPQVEWVEYFDRAAQRYRAARIENNRLESVVFISPTPQLPQRDWLLQLFKEPQLEIAQRASLLSGRPASGQAEPGPTVCACFSVGSRTIMELITREQLTTAEEIGRMLKAGTNCGSCIPELQQLLVAARQAPASQACS